MPNTPRSTDYLENFNALWKIINERYCYLEEKGVNWDETYIQYEKKLKEKPPGDDVVFFLMMSDMLKELKDGHVNLIAPFETGKYNGWKGDPTKGLNIYARSKLLGNTALFSSGGMSYGILSILSEPNRITNIGYMLYENFSSSLGDIKFILKSFRGCEAIILDVRGNGGGLVENADKLASYFIDKRTLVGYTQYKTGPGRNDFSDLKPLYLSPSESIRWTSKPLVILQDRGCYSATNDFIYKVTTGPNVTTIGLPTGGGGGMPSMSELPNGWRVRYSAVRTYDREKKSIEGGRAPDLIQQNDSYYTNPAAEDLILRRAFKYIISITKPTEQ